MALQKGLGLRRVEQSIHRGKLISYGTGDMVFGRHHSWRTRSSLDKLTRGEML